jgi:hypothetical protein
MNLCIYSVILLNVNPTLLGNRMVDEGANVACTRCSTFLESINFEVVLVSGYASILLSLRTAYSRKTDGYDTFMISGWYRVS